MPRLAFLRFRTVFPNRAFHHSAVYANKTSRITKPQDLNGKTMGELAVYSHDAGSILKGVLFDEYRFKPVTCLPVGYRRSRLAVQADRLCFTPRIRQTLRSSMY